MQIPNQDTDSMNTQAPSKYTTKATGFHKLLKEGTQELHDQAESGDFQTRMISGDIIRAEFGQFLGQMRLVHEVLDPALSHAAEQDQRVTQIFDESHLRLPRIEADLADLDISLEQQPLPATQTFIDFIQSTATASPVSLIGALYVKEGATNGNKFVAKRLRESLNLKEGEAMRYHDPHGKDQRRKWNRFKELLNELGLSSDEEVACVKVAQETFRMVMNISREISQSNTVVS